MLQVGRELRRHVGEVAGAVVMQQHALRVGAVAPRHDSTTDKEVDVPVAVVIGRDDARAARSLRREVPLGLVELAMAVVEVESVLQRRSALRVFVAATDDIEVRPAVAIGVEKHGAEILRERVGRKDRLVGAGEASVALLNEELSRLTFGAADEDVVESIAVHVADG